MTLLRVQQPSHPSVSVGSSGDVAMVLAAVVLTILVVATLLLVSDWRQLRAGDGATLAKEAEQWLRRQFPGP